MTRMTEKEYWTLLNHAPADHLSTEFEVFLMNNNEVVAMLENWLIIKNCKYHTDESPWYTAFHRCTCEGLATSDMGSVVLDVYQIYRWMPEGMAIMMRPEEERTVRRPHFHIFNPPQPCE